MCQFLEGNTGGLCEVTAANVQLSTVDLTVLMGAGPDTSLDSVRQALLDAKGALQQTMPMLTAATA